MIYEESVYTARNFSFTPAYLQRAIQLNFLIDARKVDCGENELTVVLRMPSLKMCHLLRLKRRKAEKNKAQKYKVEKERQMSKHRHE